MTTDLELRDGRDSKVYEEMYVREHVYMYM